MKTYQNLSNQTIIIPNIGEVPPQGTIETEIEISNPNLKPINKAPAAPAPTPEPPQPVQTAPEQKNEENK